MSPGVSPGASPGAPRAPGAVRPRSPALTSCSRAACSAGPGRAAAPRPTPPRGQGGTGTGPRARRGASWARDGLKTPRGEEPRPRVGPGDFAPTGAARGRPTCGGGAGDSAWDPRSRCHPSVPPQGATPRCHGGGTVAGAAPGEGTSLRGLRGRHGGPYTAGALPPPLLPLRAPGRGRAAALDPALRVLPRAGRLHRPQPALGRAPAPRRLRLLQSAGELEGAFQTPQRQVPAGHLLPRPGGFSHPVLVHLHGAGVPGLRGGGAGAQVHQRANECVRALRLFQAIRGGQPVPNVLHPDFDLSVLKDGVDLAKVAVMGHSFGGVTAVLALVKEPSFRCAVALDAWMFPLENTLYPEVPRPVLFINAEKFQTPESIAKMKRLSSRNSQTRIITVLGSVHHSQTDFAFLTGKLVKRIFSVGGTLDPHKGLDITSRAALAFLQRHLDLREDFDRWDHLLDGIGDSVVPEAPPCLSNL
nr:platelet-activating factor acetylhydrolase 2, cytoplasmic isoform X2 [Anser cygnoides]